TATLWISVGPSTRLMAPPPPPSDMALETPRAPWRWVHLMEMSVRMSAASTLQAETYWRTAAVDELSMSQAVYTTSSRNCWIWIQESAIHSCTACLSASREPCVCRERARSHIMSNIFLAPAMDRMAWWM